MKKRVILWLTAGALVVAAVCVYGLTPKEPDVTAHTVQRGSIVQQIEVTGEVRASDSYQVMSDTGGSIQRVHAAEGDMVEKGQALIQLDTRQIDAQLDIARLEYQNALDTNNAAVSASVQQRALAQQQEEAASVMQQGQGDLARQLALQMAQSSSADLGAFNSQMEQSLSGESREAAAITTPDNAPLPAISVPVSTTQLNLLRTKIEQLESQRNAMTLRSLIDGKILYVNAKEGEVLQPGACALIVGNMDALDVSAQVEQQDLAQMKTGQKAYVYNEASSVKYRAVVGDIAEMAMSTQSALGSETVGTVDITPLQHMTLKPGVTVPVYIETQRQDSTLTVPLECVFQDEHDAYVVKIADGRLKKTSVILGLSNDFDAAVSAGLLSEGDTIASSLPEGWHDGMQVNVVD